MRVLPIKTHKITTNDTDILAIVDRYVPKLKENTVLAVTSKIVAICEGSVVKIGTIEKDELVRQEAEMYIPREENKYGIFLTIKHGIMIASAGIDESNGNGFYVLWPRSPQETANRLREYLLKRDGLRHVGITITDSKIIPMRRGITGISLRHSGFAALNDYIGKPDIFGRHLHLTKANVADSLAATAVGVMGEGSEQTPLVLIENAPYVTFQDRNPTEEELSEMLIPIKEDIYGSMLTQANWRKGGAK